jgi:inhibitor of the pro-sigma K processing machinery
MEVGIFLAYAAGLLLIYLMGKFLLVPLKWAGRLLANSIIGGLALILVNAAGGYMGILIPLNPITAGISGILGIPGIVWMLLLFNS